MREPLLSIVIVSFETSSLILRRAIQSVLEQSYRNYEIILVDANESGSDYSLGLREDMEQYPDIPVITCPSRKGEFAAAKNEGAAQANGTYLAFLMARDAWNQECAASQIEVLEEHPDVGLVFCHSWAQEEDALSTGYRRAPQLPAETGQTAGLISQEEIRSVSQVIFRRTVFDELLGFDTHIRRQDDYDMWIRVAGKARIAAVDQNLVCSYVERDVLRRSHRLIDVVGYLQLYSKHQEMYRKNPAARLELYRKIAVCYRTERYYFTWIKYAVRIRVLEMRLGKKRGKPEAEAVQEQLPSYDLVTQQEKEFIAVVKSVSGKDGRGIPEKEAQFQIYLKSAGSFEQARTNERDTLVCDDEGYARSKGMSQGVYVVHQEKWQEGTVPAEDFEVTLDRSGKTHTISVSSPWQQYFVKVVRTDAGTGRTIPLSGGGYRLTDEDGALLSMTVTYPEPRVLECFETGENGYFITPEKLRYGTYYLSEDTAPYGYAKNDAPVSFRVSEQTAELENGIPVVTVSAESSPQKGRIHLHRSGPVRAVFSRSENTLKNSAGHPVGGNEVYTPCFEEGNGRGACCDIIADEDIITADGTLRAAKDTVVETVVTDENGDAWSMELYLGRYRIEEKTAPYGLVRMEEPCTVCLEYEESGVPCTEAGASFAGERQKVRIHLEKTLGEDRIFGIGTLGEIRGFAFGLFTAEQMEMADGSEIPADSLLEVLYCGDDGKACSSVDLPWGSYYVKEILADSHYRCSDRRYPVKVEYQDQDTEEVHLYVNDGNPISSEMIRGTIGGVTADQNNHPLAMAEIGLFAAGTSELAKERAVLVSVADWNGVFSFKDIPCGDYIVKEVGTPHGYALNEAVYYVSLTFDGQRVDVKLISPRLAE